MTKRKRQPLLKLTLSLCLMTAWAAADDYTDARENLVAAYQSGDFAAMVQAANDSLGARPAYPGAFYNVAFSQVLAGNHDEAFDALDELARRRIDYAIEGISAFAPLLEHPRYVQYQQAIGASRETIGDVEVAWQLPDGQFVPEGIAIVDENLLLGSIRKGTILRVSPNGDVQTVLDKPEAGSIYGMRLIDGDLWFAAANTEQFIGDSAPTTGLYALDLDRKELRSRHPLPKTETWQTLGDLVEFRGDLITADQTDGRLYVFDRETQTYSVLLERGALRSPQGMVIDGTTLFIADWNGGLFKLDLDTRELTRVDGGATSLYGIDGLYQSGAWLIAIQNGIRPNRVTALRLSESGNRVLESRVLAMNHAVFDEPNLGVVADGAFYFIANSHWNRFDRDNALPDGSEWANDSPRGCAQRLVVQKNFGDDHSVDRNILVRATIAGFDFRDRVDDIHARRTLFPNTA